MLRYFDDMFSFGHAWGACNESGPSDNQLLFIYGHTLYNLMKLPTFNLFPFPIFCDYVYDPIYLTMRNVHTHENA